MEEEKMIKIKNRDMLKLIGYWEGHIINEINCKECKDKDVKCPINNFFMKAKKELSLKLKKRKVKWKK